MDVTAPKSTHVIDSIVAAAKGGENSDGSGEQGISFSTVLKANGNLFKSGPKNNSLDSILSRNSGQSDTQEADATPTQDSRDEIQQARRDDGYDDNAMNNRRDDHQSSAAPVQNDDIRQSHNENTPIDAAPQHREVPVETQNGAAQTATDKPVDATAQNGGTEQPQVQAQAVDNPTIKTGPTAPNPTNIAADGNPGAALQSQAQGSAAQTNAATPLAAATAATQDAKGDKPVANASQAAIVAAPARQQNSGEAKKAADPTIKTANAEAATAADETQTRASKNQAQPQTPSQAKGPDTHAQAQGQPTVSAEMQAAKQAQNNAKAQESNTPAQQQAQDLSKRLDPGTSVEVNVSVDDKSAQLTSRPSASLAQASNKGATATGAQAQSANAQQGPAANAAAQNPAANIQAQGAAPVQPGQAATPGAAAQAATAGVTAAAGVDGASSANSAGQTAGASQPNFAQQAQAAANKQEAAKPQQAQHQHQRAVIDQVNVQITKAMKAGADTIRIQMKPAALGRVDVHLEISDGRVTATVYADNKETLEMLQRGSRDLARALNSAGLHADSDNLNFNLREQGGQHQQANQSSRGHHTANAAEAAGADAAPTPDLPQYQGIRADGRIDIHA